LHKFSKGYYLIVNLPRSMDFEKYLNDFNSTINIGDFILNVAIVTILAFVIKLFYIRFGRAISNRKKFSNNFVPLALSTLLIITVIKSSVALSLGLVGALSIVRFRAAIKDPEELTYLFLIIGLGLIGGANKPILALVSFAIFLPLLYINNRIKTTASAIENSSTLHITSNLKSIDEVSNILARHSSFLQLKRADFENGKLMATFVCKFESPHFLDECNAELLKKDPDAHFSFVDQPDLLL